MICAVPLMGSLEPIRDIAEQLGRSTNQFEPGTAFYRHVVERARSLVRHAHTRDDIARAVSLLDQQIVPHLADGPRQAFLRARAVFEGTDDALPVEAFKEGFSRGTGEKPPDEAELRALPDAIAPDPADPITGR
jgi:hypothetical protein